MYFVYCENDIEKFHRFNWCDDAVEFIRRRLIEDPTKHISDYKLISGKMLELKVVNEPRVTVVEE